MGFEPHRVPAAPRSGGASDGSEGERVAGQATRPDGLRRHIRTVPAAHRAVRLRSGQLLPVRGQRLLDRRHRCSISHRCRRDQPPVAGAVHLRARARHHLLVGPLGGAEEPEGLPHPDAGSRNRHERHVRRLGPRSVLHLLRSRPAPHVLHDRGVGGQVDAEDPGLQTGDRDSPLRVDQVLPLHAVRVCVHAPGLPRPLLQLWRAHVPSTSRR